MWQLMTNNDGIAEPGRLRQGGPRGATRTLTEDDERHRLLTVPLDYFGWQRGQLRTPPRGASEPAPKCSDDDGEDADDTICRVVPETFGYRG